jgi:hypothetical protein
MPPSAKSKTMISPGRLASPVRNPLVSSTMDALGTYASSTIPRSVLMSPWCIKCLAPPLGQRVTWRSSASGSLVLRPHCGQEVNRSSWDMVHREKAPQMRRMVVPTRGIDALRPRGVSNWSMAMLSCPKWERSLGLVERGAFARTHKKCRQSPSRWRPAVTKRFPFGAQATSPRDGETVTSNEGGMSVATLPSQDRSHTG